MQNTKIWIFSHKKTSIIVLLALLALGYFIYKTLNPIPTVSTYVLGEVKKGTIVSTVTGTGQVSALNQLNLTPKVSGTITSVRVKPGEYVGAGQTLFTIDSQAAQKRVRDAELDLNTTLANYENAKKNNDLAVQNAYTNLLNSNLEITAMDSLTDRATKPTLSGNYTLGKEGSITITTYATGSGVYASIQGLTTGSQVFNTLSTIPIGDSGLYLTLPSTISSSMNWKINIPNVNATNYISNKNTYDQAVRNRDDALRSDGPTLLSIEAKKNALADAKQALDDYYVKAIFGGIVATVPVNIGDQVGTGTTLSTIITKQQIATIPLNEVDIAKIKIGQKITATFDAIDGLEVTGKVISMDMIGTVTSGVVNYNVKIGFDTSDDRIKPGMSTNVSIATKVAQDVLMVPTSAIKNINGTSYIQLAPSGSKATIGNAGITLTSTPEQIEVTKGISDDLNTEIISGLKEGDIIITKTNTTKVAATTTTAPSILGNGGARLGR